MTEHPLLGEWTEYTWCFHCEKVYPTKKWEAKDWGCPTPVCDGSAFDAKRWGTDGWSRNAHPEYPEVPAEGKEYPLYE